MPGMTFGLDVVQRDLAAFQAAFGLGTAVGPLVGVVLWDRLGPTTWLVSAGAALVALVAARAAMRTTFQPTTLEESS